MKLLVQEYLETHSFGELAAEHGVYASFSKSGHKFSLNYDQIEAKESNPLAQECRGLILSSNGMVHTPVVIPGVKPNYDDIIPGQTTILAFPMKRFFNYGQGSAAEVNWSDPELAVLEKLDGTLCIVYWDPFTSNWCVATRSVPEADMLMDNGLYTFRSLFEKAMMETVPVRSFNQFTQMLDQSYTYCFELTTPYNRIVVDYKKSSITLLAVRGLVTHQELKFDHPVVERLMDVPLVQGHKYTTTEELLNWVSTLNPMEHEGVVVRDSKFNRIKVKNAAYVAYNKLNDRLGSSERNLMEFILLEKDDDVAGFLPEEIVKNMTTIKEGLQKALAKHDSVYNLVKLNLKAQGLEGIKKEFALAVTQHKDLWHAPFFSMFDGKSSSMKDFLQKSKKDGTWGDGFLDKMLELSKKA